MRYFFFMIILSAIALTFIWQPSYKLTFLEKKTSAENTDQGDSANVAMTSKSAPEKVHSAEPQYDVNWDHGIKDFVPNPEAIASMRQARMEGDPRAPKLGKSPEREKPTKEELTDHGQYLEYERRQQKRMFRAYVEASKIKTAKIRSIIEQGKTAGISAEQISAAEDKIRGIEDMATQLQQDYPDIMEVSYQPPADWLIENLGKDEDSVKTAESNAHAEQ